MEETFRNVYEIGLADNGFTVCQPEHESFEVIEEPGGLDDNGYERLGQYLGRNMAGDIEGAEVRFLAKLSGCHIKGFLMTVSIEPIMQEGGSDGEGE